jgi:hypothetical protein
MQDFPSLYKTGFAQGVAVLFIYPAARAGTTLPPNLGLPQQQGRLHLLVAVDTFTMPASIVTASEAAMVTLAALWLPILLSAVIVFIASSIMHMVLPYHRSDYVRLPDEDGVTAALRTAGVKRGRYIFPHCTHENMKSPEVVEKYKQGPVGMLTIFPSGPPKMGKFLGLWFGFLLIIGIFVAYLAGRTLAPGTHYLQVFRVAGTAAFLAYGLGNLANGIWKGQPWPATIKEVVDGLIYGLLTAGTFGWLWPR